MIPDSENLKRNPFTTLSKINTYRLFLHLDVSAEQFGVDRMFLQCENGEIGKNTAAHRSQSSLKVFGPFRFGQVVVRQPFCVNGEFSRFQAS